MSADQRLMSDISDNYSLGIYPLISTDITRMFGAVHRTLEHFVVEDVNYYTKSYEGDRNL